LLFGLFSGQITVPITSIMVEMGSAGVRTSFFSIAEVLASFPVVAVLSAWSHTVRARALTMSLVKERMVLISDTISCSKLAHAAAVV